MISSADALAQITARLAAAGIEHARREARLILAAALGTDAAGLLAAGPVDEALFAPMAVRRAAREPLAYILGRREFWGLEFAVSPATLIPRPDSETLIEAALVAFPQREAVRRMLDLGTGTGCLLLAALHEFPAAFGVGADISYPAARLASHNAHTLGLAPRAAFLAGDWAAAVAGKFDLVFCNPPYIRAEEIAGLMPEVETYEPRLALDGGADGLAAYRAVIAALRRLLAPGGVAVIELGLGQAREVADFAQTAGLRAVTRRDLAGIPRAMQLRACGGAGCK